MTDKQFAKIVKTDKQGRDELGFTPEDYENMQELHDHKGVQGDTLLDGYDVTKEQIQAINEKDRFAIDMFFYVNEKRIRNLAYKFLRDHGYIVSPQFAPLLTIDDCVNQAYLDMRRGFLRFEYKEKYISALLCHSFYYALVGGFGDEDGAYLQGVKYE
ncbi:MAG: hypothetical protein K2N74_05755, partial [Clostridiales bacterium]|nr:hypothetical protein [Clostridiales bacterium]